RQLAPAGTRRPGSTASARLPSREAVAAAANRLYQMVEADLLQSLAQPADMNVDGAFLDVHIPTPPAVQQLGARVDALGVLHEELEHAVFSRAQRYFLFA